MLLYASLVGLAVVNGWIKKSKMYSGHKPDISSYVFRLPVYNITP